MSEQHGVALVVRTVKRSQGLSLRNHSKELFGRGAHPLSSPALWPPSCWEALCHPPHAGASGASGSQGEAVSGPLASPLAQAQQAAFTGSPLH